MAKQFDLPFWPTTVDAADGKYHPAIQEANGRAIYYWPNITCATEEKAAERAALACKDAYDALNAVAGQWHIFKK